VGDRRLFTIQRGFINRVCLCFTETKNEKQEYRVAYQLPNSVISVLLIYFSHTALLSPHTHTHAHTYHFE